MKPLEWIGPESSISRSMLSIPPRPSATRALTRRRAAERVVAEVEDREPVHPPDALALVVDHDRALADQLLDPLLEQVRAVLASCDREVDVALPPTSSCPCSLRPEARLGDESEMSSSRADSLRWFSRSRAPCSITRATAAASK